MLNVPSYPGGLVEMVLWLQVLRLPEDGAVLQLGEPLRGKVGVNRSGKDEQFVLWQVVLYPEGTMYVWRRCQ